MQSKPLISIVIATYNASKTLDRCIQSIVNQTYKNVEIVVWDGASTDETVQVLKKWSPQIAFWKSEKDQGIYDAWNKALDHVQGEWICFLGADDFLWDSRALEQMAPILEASYPDYRIVYGSVRVVQADGTLLEDVGKPWQEVSQRFLHEMCIPHQGTFHHCELFKEHGKFDPSFRITGDYDFLLRELRSRDALFVPEMIISGMQFGGVSSRLSSTLTNIRELRRSRTNNGIRFPSWMLLMREIRARTRSVIQKCLGKGFADTVADTYRVMTGKPKVWTRLKAPLE